MDVDEPQLDTLLHSLQERAKELNCIYSVDELLKQLDRSMAEICRGIVDILPQGWQFPESCDARIILEEDVFQKPGFEPTRWVQSANIIVNGQILGRVEVFYREQVTPPGTEPFLKEERTLIDTVAERISMAFLQRRLQAASFAPASAKGSDKGKWRVILDFLRGTDPVLLQRISRKMINHLAWNGISEAKELLQRGGGFGEENRPLRRYAGPDTVDLTTVAFQIAAERLSETEISGCITAWMKEERSGFLVLALENQDSSLGEIIQALERYRHSAADESELSVSTQKGLRVSLIRQFFSDNLEFINVAKDFIKVRDFHELLGRIIFPPRCHGKLGGKTAGLFLAKKIIEKAPEASQLLGQVKVPKTWYITSDWILNFVHYNDLEDVLNGKYRDVDQVRQEYPRLVQLFKSSSFPSELGKGLSLALDDLGDSPIIVRSSSLLEDRSGSAFSGKYKSLFLGNQGSKEARLAALMDAIAEVYASIFGPDPTEYRAEHGLLDVNEEMGIMIQAVVGKKVGKYFFPACAGVAFSNNEFCWSARISRSDGLIRIVPGLGTRAVDRVADDYPVLIAPGQPNLTANVTVDEVTRYSPNRVDVINLETNAFETLFTFEGLIRETQFVGRIRELLQLLQSKFGCPVDVEFAHDGKDFYLLQCRPQSYGADVTPVAIPQNIPADKILFSAVRFVSNGRVPDITHIVYVDPEGYARLPEETDMRDIGRAVGRLNKLLPKRQFILVGPGRWGSRGDIKLGVPVTYSEINNTAMLIEVARQRGNYLPDLSFGTHFFQDLVEASIRYLPLYPDDPNVVFNEPFFRCAHNMLADILPDFASLAGVLRVIEVSQETGGLILRVLMNADLDQAVAFFSPIQQKASPVRTDFETGGPSEDEHWRWRFLMAQRIAEQLDARQFGVEAFYLIGSTKNATAGPASDIDILLHFKGTDQQRQQLLFWLEGWSRCLSEINFFRTGYRTDGLLDVHLITDEDISARSSFAAKIGAITDPARKLQLKK
jgi:hypothetical protein